MAVKEDKDTDAAAIARLDRSSPSDQEMTSGGDTGPSFKIAKARCLNVSIRAGSTTGGTTPTARFQISEQDAAEIIAEGVIGRTAFDIEFGQRTPLGDGWTIKSIAVRPDADGAAIAWLGLVAPSTATRTASLLGAKDLVAKEGPLLLKPSAVTMEEMLTKKAPEAPAADAPRPLTAVN